MNKQLSYLIIGNGIAGVTAAEILRAEDTASSITIVADDPFPVYYRPALKDYLAGRVHEEKLWARPSTFYQQQRIRFVPGRVIAINALQHVVQLQNGQQIGYHKLLLANGARPRRLTCPGLGLAGVTTLRTVADYQQVVRRLGSANRIVICGSGTLALESAEALQHRGYQVTHLLRHHTLWSEVLDSTASDLVLQEERRAGVDVRTEESISEIVGTNGQVSAVITSSGAHLPCAMVLIAIGIDPIIDFIQPGGIRCGRGVKVDAAMRTNVADIYAAGDVIETTDSWTGRTRVLGQWYPAVQQARVAAYNMLNPDGAGTSGDAANASMNYYNATFLYGLDFVSIGLTTQPAAYYQEIVAEPQPRSYRKVLLHNGVAVGALFLGERKQALAFKRAIDHRVNVTPIVNRLFADDFKLDDWLDRQHVPPPILNMDRRNLPTDKQFYFSLRPLHMAAGSPHATMLQSDGAQQDSNASRTIPGAILAALKDTPTLVLVSKDAEPEIIPLEPGKRLTLGRDSENDIVLRDTATSRRHAELFTAADGFYVRDLDSRNGVFVNEEFPAINRGYVLDKSALYPYHLSHGDSLVIGNVLLYFSFPQAAQEQRRPSDRPGPTSTCSINRHSTDAAAVKRPVGLAHRADVQELSEERIHFEIDMCIGCDRCMYACPIPMSSMVSIADLNHATVSADVAAHVARFTHECIMCGSCVPVCPVDNHRDLLMLTLKQRLGVSWDSEVDIDRITRALPRGWTVSMLISRLREHPLFRDAQVVPDRYLLHLFAASKRLALAPGATVVREGDYGRDLYLILAGRLSLFAMGVDEQEFPLAVLGQGECVGEYGMLTGQPYAATARAQVPSVVLQVPEQVMQRLMELAPTVRQFFDQLNNARSLAAILKRMALFQGVSNANIDMLVQHTQVKQYDRNERLFAEDDQGGRPARETLHILLEGFVKVARHTTGGTGHHKTDERIIAYRQAGDYFVGGLDLLGDGRAVSVTTINRARVAEVPRPLMLALLQRYPEVNQRFTLRLQEYVESAIAVQPDLVATDSQSGARALPNAAGLHALVSDGVIEGTEVLLIDLDTCIHCNECEEACARRHGHSRMNRKGMVVGNISIATACRQCQDPVCMLCSRAGIARLPNGEVYITESCIGCGICADRCPYGAISIVDVEGKELPAINRGTTWERFNSFFAKGAARKGERTVPMLSTGGHYTVPGPLDISRPRSGYEEMRKKIAIKCDLCAGYKDQACVEACPTGAAIRVQPTTFFGSTEAILRRLA